MSEKSKILVVDDEKSNLRLMEAMLLPLGYEILMARDGQEAIETLRAQAVDLILLDLMMPRMDGFEAARRIKADPDTRIIPVVIVTALQEVQDRVRALEAGADDFLTKPVDKTELRARVASLLKVKAYNDHMRSYQRELEAEVDRRTRDLKKAFEKIKSASLETVYRLTRAAEYKDEETGAHIQRMSNYAAAIGQTMGLNDKVVESLLYAAPMHDIGKIGIPDRILLKPAKLDAEEWEIMKTHTLIGARILEGSGTGFIRLGEVIALTHHEKWDGSGYPRGLRGNRIPLAGRIVALADVFDALTSKRSYKEAFPLEKSFEIIRAGRGGHFDPAVVDAFFSTIDRLLAIRERFGEDREHALPSMPGAHQSA